MLYCHDSYGLGHIKRTLSVSRHLRAHWPGAAQLLVTGSPLAHRLVGPDDPDYVKLPSVLKVGAGRYEARSLPLVLGEMVRMRSEMLLSAARHFRPDLLVVDHAPAGLEGEILPTLRELRRRGARLVVGLRDVVDDAPVVRTAWRREGVYDLLADVYDRILVYGQPDVYDVAREYAFPRQARAKTRYVGYLRRAAASPADEVRAGARAGVPLVLVTAGGGGDGDRLVATSLEALGPAAALDPVIVAGPFARQTVRGRVLEFVDDLASYVAAADAVVAMGGYNSVCEILSFERPAVLVPRVRPRKEQLIRAQRLSGRGLVRMVHPDELTPRRLLAEVRTLLEAPRRPARPVALDGLAATAHELESLAAAG
jgi:predicted glycosyltransferase